MWPTLQVGTTYRVLSRGARRPRVAVLLGVAPDGELLLAQPPQTPRGRWRPWALARGVVRGVFTASAS